jgi:MFS family permease
MPRPAMRYGAWMREPLRHRRFRFLFAAQCASFLGDAIFMVALSFAVLQVTGSAAALGTVLASGAALLVATFAISGVWADRLPRVRIMVTSDVVRAIAQATLAALLLTDSAQLWHLLVLNGVHNVGMAFFQPARVGLMPQLLTPGLLVAGNGLMSLAESIVWTAGWAIGGILVAMIGPGWAIAIDAATFVVSAVLLLAIGRVPAAHAEPTPDGATTPTPSAAHASFVRELREGWSEVRSRRWIWFTLLWATMFLLLYEGPMQVIGPVAMSADWDGARSWGFLLAGLGVGSAIGALLAASGRLSRPLLVSLWLFLACALLPVLVLAQVPLWALVACNVVVGASFGLFDPVWTAALQTGVPASMVSRVSAWDWMCSLAGMPVGMALAGWATEAFGRDPVLVAMAIGSLVVSIVFLREPAVRGIDARARATRSPSVPGR